jgi:hypothetical protein
MPLGPGRRATRRTARRTTRRTVHRMHRRRRRRRLLVGGMVVLAVGGTAAAIKMSQKDAQRVEEHTGASVEELTEDELVAAMKDLGIQSIELTDEDKAAVVREGNIEPDEADDADDAAAPAAEADYLDELERLGTLRDRGIITEEEFQAKKKQLLGL